MIASWFQDKEKAKETYNKVFSALTLTSPELANERQKLEQEETRKENLHKTLLSTLLPWETNDADSKILEDECKDAILSLSNKEETFMTGVSEEELEQLDGFSLLKEFDLDMHFSLIQRLLDVDSNLVEMQAQFSGAGEHEMSFWKNYFHRCALIRKKVGLDVNEIWGIKHENDGDGPNSTDNSAGTSSTSASVTDTSSSTDIDKVASSASISSDTANATSSNGSSPTTSTPAITPSGQPATAEKGFMGNISSNVVSGAFASNGFASASKLVGGFFNNASNSPQSQNVPAPKPAPIEDSYEIVKNKAADNDDDLDDLAAEIAKELGE